MTDQEKLKEFVDYWDEWHKEWWGYFNKKPSSPFCIKKEWSSPFKFDDARSKSPTKIHLTKLKKNYEEIYKFFPEPYWMDTSNISDIRAVFFNINPGSPENYHHFNNGMVKRGSCLRTEKDDVLIWEEIYKQKNKYSLVIKELIDNYNDSTKFWHIRKRVNWLNEFRGFNKLKLKNIASFDLVPWHTNKSDEIISYIKSKGIHDAIIEYLLKPALMISSFITKGLSNKIICFGAPMRDMLEKNIESESSLLNKRRHYIVVHSDNFLESSLLDIYQTKGADGKNNQYICVFWANQNMALPKNNSIVFRHSKGKSYNMKENKFIQRFENFLLSDFDKLFF